MTKSKRRHPQPSRLPQILILGGVILLAGMILALKQNGVPADDASTSSSALPEAQLDRALKANQPTLAFFHSNNCQQCIEMIGIVDQVYPEFKNTVTLVDIDVYDERNMALLNRVGLQYIPTLIFYDHNGKEQVSVGVMQAKVLRQTLAALAGGG
ncbi:MAG: thioredoxin family protein [Anaerolineales bacterium]|nr:thioredoxin family protein [Anaerolineales bacterium]